MSGTTWFVNDSLVFLFLCKTPFLSLLYIKHAHAFRLPENIKERKLSHRSLFGPFSKTALLKVREIQIFRTKYHVNTLNFYIPIWAYPTIHSIKMCNDNLLRNSAQIL